MICHVCMMDFLGKDAGANPETAGRLGCPAGGNEEK